MLRHKHKNKTLRYFQFDSIPFQKGNRAVAGDQDLLCGHGMTSWSYGSNKRLYTIWFVHDASMDESSAFGGFQAAAMRLLPSFLH